MRKLKKLVSVCLILILVCTCFECLAVYASNENVVSFQTPASASECEVLWDKQIGTSYKNAPSTMTVVEDTVILMSRKTLYKFRAKDGSVIQEAERADTPSYSYTSPLYADGVLYCPLDNATVQAFDYETMQPLWIFKDKLGGQSLTPIKYSDGCIYTGFWNDEEEYADYVCIDVTDEDKSSTSEAKQAKWAYKSLGGFYWAGCAFSGNHVIFGTDDGTPYSDRDSKVLMLNKSDGKVSDALSIKGDQRSGITIRGGTAYFVTKAGYLYSVKIHAGKFDPSSLKKLSLGGESTSTPVVYGNRLYVGVQGTTANQSSLKVIDAEKLSVIYSAPTNGYMQNAALISDAYLQDTGKIYIYATYNAPPGGITVYTDSENQTKASKAELFVPEATKAGYGISDIVCDENGTLFFKNDSGYVFAVAKKTQESTGIASIFINFLNRIIHFIKKILQKAKGI